MIQIKPQNIKDATVSVPGSKSYSHRILIAASLSDGACEIENCLKSKDTLLTMGALKQMGIEIQEEGDRILVQGSRGVLKPCPDDIFLGNSGTSMRLLTAVAAMGSGKYRLIGTPRMHQRPIQDLIEGLKQLGVNILSIKHNGCPPLEIAAGKITGGRVELNCSTSSQYLSALLLIAPYTAEGMEINVAEGPVSRPYIDMTVDVMEKLGMEVRRDGYRLFQVGGNKCYRSGTFLVEPDASQAGYFWAAAAVTGAAVKVKGIFAHSTQGDAGFTRILEAMGCRVVEEADGVKVIGGPLRAVEADMVDMPDLVPTLAVIAGFARGTTLIRNVGHLKAKESNRLASVATELNKMGIETSHGDTELSVKGGTPHGSSIETYDDHRLAMSFAVAGLKVPGVVIQDEQCVDKSFPSFWDVLHTLQE
jgi:3-phosphoshikimate 1-carboxyvinyltransferase